MENSFLRQLSRKILQENPDGTEALTVVFPSRRACLFFEKAFAEECAVQKKGCLVPSAQALEDWVCRFTSLRLADSLTLAALLYQAYKDSGQPLQEFEHFIAWAEILLEDFSEIDVQLADAGRIFSQGLEENRVDAAFADFLTDDEKHLIAGFWKSFSRSRLSGKPSEFVRQWEAMPAIYNRLGDLLRTEGLAYHGMLAKDASLALDEFLPTLEKHYFAGFAGFYKAHLSMIERMMKAGKATLVWDADAYYVDGPSPDGTPHEAGLFFRRYRKHNPLLAPTLNDLPDAMKIQAGEQHVQEFEAPNRIGMAKALSTILMGEPGANPTNTAIVLCDEGLLVPVIQSLPLDLAGSVNVTSGIPISKSQLFTLLVDCANLFHHFERHTKRTEIETGRLEPILRHPYVAYSGKQRVPNFLRYIANSQLISVHLAEAATLPGLGGRIFKLMGKGLSFRSFLDELFKALILFVKDMDDQWRLEEVKVALFKWNRLKDQFDQNSILHGADLWQAYRKSLYGTSLDFGGEPLIGLQVMGLLESRCLDFEHVVILGANEGLLPSPRKRPGFLPYHIRGVYGLFAREEEESLNAYYLMRLFHKAKSVSLVYAGSEEKTDLGEKSRYIRQLEFESPYQMGLTRTVGGTRLGANVPIRIQKTPAVMERLMESVNRNGEPAPKPLHPSSLIRYLKCPLAFYLTNIAALREPDDIVRDVDQRHFGTLLHKAMERLYLKLAEIKGTTMVEASDREWLEENVEEAVREAVRETFDLADVKERSGEGILSLAVLSANEYAQKLVELDLGYTPFQIVQIEGKAARPWQIRIPGNFNELEVPLHGTMDRVDLKGHTYRVVDFKTGTVSTRFSTVEELFERERPANTAAFQIILYSLILKKSLPFQDIKVEPALVSVKETSHSSYAYPEEPRLKLKGGGSGYQNIDIDQAEDAFTSGLVSLLTEIFDPKIDFTQTRERATCASCSFNSLCHKD